MYKDRKTKRVIHLLGIADRFNRLAKACPAEYREDFYKMKDRSLSKAMVIGSDEFLIDSVVESPSLIVGITHLPSGRMIHLRPRRLSVDAQVVIRRLAHQVGHAHSFWQFAQVSPRNTEGLRPILKEGAA
ncbi:MAG: hypothetical protein LLG01_16730 [Planctomycetaceae bacterium]|nr:hypothetical protein [Planctomycetaceae bacterium]